MDLSAPSPETRRRPAACLKATEPGVLTAETTRAPLHLAFPVALASHWMPELSPERTT
jgi:hypothetical protein